MAYESIRRYLTQIQLENNSWLRKDARGGLRRVACVLPLVTRNLKPVGRVMAYYLELEAGCVGVLLLTSPKTVVLLRET
jgi:hypothetical protein